MILTVVNCYNNQLGKKLSIKTIIIIIIIIIILAILL